MNKKKFTAAIAAAAMLIPTAAAFATETRPPEGGVWQWGSHWDHSEAWSNYWHSDANHGSTVLACDKASRQDVGANQWSKASVYGYGTFCRANAYYRIN